MKRLITGLFREHVTVLHVSVFFQVWLLMPIVVFWTLVSPFLLVGNSWHFGKVSFWLFWVYLIHLTPKGWVFGTPPWVFFYETMSFSQDCTFLYFSMENWQCLMINLEILVVKMSKNTFTLIKAGPWNLICLYFFWQNFKLTPILSFSSKIGLAFFSGPTLSFLKTPKKRAWFNVAISP